MSRQGDWFKTLAAAALAVVVGLGTYAAVRWGPGSSSVPASFRYDLRSLADADQGPLLYRAQRDIAVRMPAVTAVAVWSGGSSDSTTNPPHVLVAGPQRLEAYTLQGTCISEWSLPAAPTCLAVTGDEHVLASSILVGYPAAIECRSETGELRATWTDFPPDALLTALAVDRQHVFAADARHRVVYRLDAEGRPTGVVGSRDSDREMPEFLVPSLHFDLAADDSLLHAVNPGALRIQAYSADGQLQSLWGHGGSGREAFFGCCNPARLALLPDGSFVTSEKGIPRIRLFDPAGRPLGLVAGPRELNVRAAELGDSRGPLVFDIDTDRQKTVYVLDPRTRTVRLFVPREAHTATESGLPAQGPAPAAYGETAS